MLTANPPDCVFKRLQRFFLQVPRGSYVESNTRKLVGRIGVRKPASECRIG